MGNLVRKKTQLLFNTLTAASMTQSTTSLDIANYNKMAPPGMIVKRFRRSVTDNGIKHAVIVTPSFGYPSDATQYEWF
jgi:hypothetical protein